MMFQILFDHLFRHLPNSGTEVTSRPKMPPPITLFQMGKFFKQITRYSPFDPPHNLAWRQSRRRAHQNMHMIFANHPAHYPYLERLTHLTNHCSNSFSNIPCQNLVAVFCHPNKVVLNLKNRMAAIPVVHDTSQNVSFYQLKLTGWKPVVLTL